MCGVDIIRKGMSHICLKLIVLILGGGIQMRYELNFDEDKIIDIEAIGDNSVLDLKDCCKLLNELNEENKKLRQERERWKNLYEIKDAEVTARVDALNKVCEYYTSKVLFKSDTDPNRAVKEVLNEILNTEVKK